MTDKRVAGIFYSFLISSLLASCGVPQSELDAANAKIAELEASIKQLQADKVAVAATPTPEKVEDNKAPEKQEHVEEQPSAWTYHNKEDEMSGGKTYTASVISSNSVSFSFPYNGLQNGTLLLRNDPKYGKDIIFRIEKGQILCSSYDGCNVLIRFDDEKPVTYSANPPADNSSEVIFISNYTKFLNNLKNAKIVRISPTIYQEGSPVFEFNVSGFDIEKYKPKD